MEYTGGLLPLPVKYANSLNLYLFPGASPREWASSTSWTSLPTHIYRVLSLYRLLRVSLIVLKALNSSNLRSARSPRKITLPSISLCVTSLRSVPSKEGLYILSRESIIDVVDGIRIFYWNIDLPMNLDDLLVVTAYFHPSETGLATVQTIIRFPARITG